MESEPGASNWQEPYSFTTGAVPPQEKAPEVVRSIRTFCIIFPTLLTVFAAIMAWMMLTSPNGLAEDGPLFGIFGCILALVWGVNLWVYTKLPERRKSMWHSVFSLLCLGMVVAFPLGAIINGLLMVSWVKPQTKYWFGIPVPGWPDPPLEPGEIDPKIARRVATASTAVPVETVVRNSSVSTPFALAPQIVRSIQWIYGLGIFIGLFGELAVLMSLVDTSSAAHFVMSPLIIGLMVGAVITLFVCQWRAVLRGARLAWYVQIGLSIIMLVGFPLGTILGAYVLYYWFQPETKAWFSV